MKRILIVALLAMTVMVVPAFASVQNIKVSGDIESSYVSRDSMDLGHPTTTNDYEQSFFITQTRLRVDADLTDNVSTTVALINERAWDAEGSANTDMDIDLAFVQMREMLYSPLTVVIGRQSFAFGNSFVIDSAGATFNGGLSGVAMDLTKRSGMDAIRATLDYNPLTIDIIYAKVDADNLDGTTPQDDDLDLYGVNANWAVGDELGTTVEGYLWAKIDQRGKDITGTSSAKADTVYMPGVKASANVLEGLNLSAELAAQYGTITETTTGGIADNVKRRALGAQVMAVYALPFEQTKDWSPVLSTVYSYASGDSGPQELAKVVGRDDDDHYTGWDPMLENQGTGNISNTLFAFSNCHTLNVTAQVSPMEDVTASLAWTGLWLDKKLNDTPAGSDEGRCTGSDCLTLYQPDGSAIYPDMTSDLKLGDELGLSVMYDYTEDVKFGGSLNWFWPGGAFYSDNEEGASQILLNTNVSF